MRKIFIVVLLLSVVGIKSARAWGKQGHRVVAQIAKNQAAKTTIDKVNAFLNGMSWEDAACWMDEVKNVAGSEFMSEWHYVNVARDKTYVRRRFPDILTQLDYFVKILRNHDMYSAGAIVEALKIIFHLVGDMSQPLHCGYPGDKGGTMLPVVFLNKNSNLHQVWDTGIIEEKNIDIWSCSKIMLALSQADKGAYRVYDLQAWLKDSRLLLTNAYAFNDGIIDTDYINRNSEVIQTQLIKAGFRLAAILDESLKARI